MRSVTGGTRGRCDAGAGLDVRHRRLQLRPTHTRCVSSVLGVGLGWQADVFEPFDCVVVCPSRTHTFERCTSVVPRIPTTKNCHIWANDQPLPPPPLFLFLRLPPNPGNTPHLQSIVIRRGGGGHLWSLHSQAFARVKCRFVRTRAAKSRIIESSFTAAQARQNARKIKLADG